MWLEPRRFGWLMAGVAVATVALSPVAAADPFGPPHTGGGAAAVIDDLKTQGYNVQINWTNGFDTKPLDECWVTSINNPGDEPPSPDTFVTVYVDVVCPNHDDGGFTGGVGIGVGF
jgi:hypothetical protein